MQRSLFATLVIALLFSTTTFAQPQGPGERRIVRKEILQGPALLKEKLNLTDAQELQMQKLQLQLMKKQTQLRSRIQALRLDTKELFLAEKVDRKAIESNIKAISEAQQQMKLNVVDHWFDVNGILNADQQKIWKKHAMMMGEQMREAVGRGIREHLRLRMHRDMGDPEDDF